MSLRVIFKIIFLLNLFVVLNTQKSFAQECKVSSQVKETVVFVDTNDAEKEIQAARLAACKQGKRFQVIKDLNSLNLKKTEELVFQAQNKQSYLDDCARLNSAEEITRCQKPHFKEFEKIQFELTKIHEQKFEPNFNKSLENLLEKLLLSGQQISSLILSGHNGGDKIDGDYGELDISDLFQSFKKLEEKIPNGLKSLESIYLLGCYTATPFNALRWKNNLSNVRIVAGFSGSGPSKDAVLGHHFLKEVMSKETELMLKADAKKISQQLRSIPSARLTSSSIAVFGCGGKSLIRYSKDDARNTFREGELTPQFICDSAETDFKAALKTVADHYEGLSVVPENTDRGILRSAYSVFRGLEQCFSMEKRKTFEDDLFLNAEQVGLLLFYKSVVGNFVKVFENEIKKFNEALLELNLEKTALSNFIIDPSQFVATFGDNRATLQMKLSDLSEFIEKSEKSNVDPKLLNPIRNLYQKMNQYLWTLDSECMDLLDWHEVTDQIPAPLCA